MRAGYFPVFVQSTRPERVAGWQWGQKAKAGGVRSTEADNV
jgi:hypothetical protein